MTNRNFNEPKKNELGVRLNAPRTKYQMPSHASRFDARREFLRAPAGTFNLPPFVRELYGQAARPESRDSAKLTSPGPNADRQERASLVVRQDNSRIFQAHGDVRMALESNSAACVSPTLVFELDNGGSFTFNFQMNGRLTVIGFQEGRAVTGSLTEEQAGELRDAISEYIHKRQG
jgi:hypothetical protein